MTQIVINVSLRDRLLAALEHHEHLCLDTEPERALVVDAVLDVLKSDEDAAAIRALFANAPTMGARIEVVASHGKRLGALIEHACNLAGCP